MAKEMKQFKKWEEEDCLSRKCSGTDCGEVACTDCEDLREAGWKACLKWVKNHSEVSKSLYMIDVNDIDEELNDD